MKLTFHTEHLSITQFDETEVSDFTVLTGVNGSGKSHLLDAIHQKMVRIDGRKNPRAVKFNFENFKLENESAYNALQLAGEREGAWAYFEGNMLPTLKSQRQGLGERYTSILQETKTKRKSFYEYAGDGYQQAIKNHLQSNAQPMVVGIFELIQRMPYSPDELTRETFLDLYKPYQQVNDFLPQALGKVIWDYYVKFRDNQVNNYCNAVEGKNYPAKTEAEFLAAHGDRPWDLINDILKRFDTLDYVVSSPEGLNNYDNFTLRLVHTKKEALQIEFGSLSSGERVLMALVASIYKASADKNFPDVLLLDEIDASLHPSMIKNLLDVIRDIFIARGLKVIMVTHSPTTIALAPEDAIYVMNKYGSKRIEKSTKRQALSILTEGFATLEEGIVFFDEVAKHPVSVITEGHNVKYLNKVLELFDIAGVKVIEGLEAVTGKSQLRTLYDFFSRVPHKHKVLFVWDCDAQSYASLPATEATFPFVLTKNLANKLVSSGIENAFDEALFNDFKTTTRDSLGVVTEHFDYERKKDFAKFVIERSQLSDFLGFSPLRDKLLELITRPKTAQIATAS